MDFKKVENFYQSLVQSKYFNEDLQKKLQKMNVEEYKIFIKDEVIPLAKRMGYNIEVDEILSYDKWKLEHLSEDELENVAGGKNVLRNSTITFMAGLSMLGGAGALQSLNTASAMWRGFSRDDTGMSMVSSRAREFKSNTKTWEINKECVFVDSGTDRESFDLLCDYLSNDPPKIKSLKVKLNGDVAEKLQKLFEALETNTNIEVVDLSESKIDDSGVKVFAEGLKKQKSIKEINLSYNSIGDEGAIALAEALKDKASLKNLNLKCNAIGDRGIIDLSEALKNHTDLENLDLERNKVGTEGAIALARMLEEITSIRSLNLSYNNIGDDGVGALAGAIGENDSSLVNLNLCNCGLGDYGAGYLKGMLIKNKSLTEINLSENRFGVAVVYLAVALKDNTTLTNINLSATAIGDEGAKYLADALKENRTLTNIDLSMNHITNEGALLFVDALRANSMITNFQFDNNMIDANVRARLYAIGRERPISISCGTFFGVDLNSL